MDYLEIKETYTNAINEIKLFISDVISQNKLINILEDLYFSALNLDEEITELEQDINDSNDNYYIYLSIDKKKEKLNKLIDKMEYITDVELDKFNIAI